MDYSVVMSGFGGQGVLMMGELLAHCGMKAGLNVTWMPAYGVEMRGGAANCTVVLSDEAIGAPITGRPSAVIAMSEPALEKFGWQIIC
jgi:2-oxoglutarate ferredoxin oxidoreductase subunit gamma